MSDGKITKSEARKLIKRGISMDKVLNQNIKEMEKVNKYRAANNRSRAGRDRGTGVALPNMDFKPVQLRKGARKTFLEDLLQINKKPQNDPKPKPKAEEKPVEEEVKPVESLPEPEITEAKVEETVPSNPYKVDNQSPSVTLTVASYVVALVSL